MRLGLPFRKKKCVCGKGRDSKRWLLYITRPARPGVDMIHVSQAFRRADALDMCTY